MCEVFCLQKSISAALSALLDSKSLKQESDSLALLDNCIGLYVKNKSRFSSASSERLEEFAGNLDHLRLFIASRLLKFKNSDSKLGYGPYVRVLSSIALALCATHKNDDFKGKTHEYMAIIHIWCSIYCDNVKFETCGEKIKRRDPELPELVTLVSSMYIRGNNPVKSAYILLEIFRYTEDMKLISQILETFCTVPKDVDPSQIYPGLVSRIVSRLPDLGELRFSAAVRCFSAWASVIFCGDNRKKEITEDAKRTSDVLVYIFKKYSNVYPRPLITLCVGFLRCNSLSTDAQICLSKFILGNLSHNCQELIEGVKNANISIKITIRDQVAQSFKNIGKTSLEIYSRYLILKDHIPNLAAVDFYIALQFLLRNIQEDLPCFSKELPHNEKYLIDETMQHTFEISPTTKKTPKEDKLFFEVALGHFRSLSRYEQRDSLYNILSCIDFKEGIEVDKVLYICKMLRLLTIFLQAGAIFEDVLEDCVGLLINKEFFDYSNLVDTDISVGNLLKVRLLCAISATVERLHDYETLQLSKDFETFQVSKDSETLIEKTEISKRDMGDLLYWMLPLCVSNYEIVADSSRHLLHCLSLYCSQLRNSRGLKPFIQYYSNILVNNAISAIKDNDGVGDILYCLANLGVLSVKSVFDIAVPLCRSCESLELPEPFGKTSDLSKIPQKGNGIILDRLYSFNYLLTYLEMWCDEDVKRIADERPNEDDGEVKDGILATVTLVATRVRYYLSDSTDKIRYLSLYATYRCFRIFSKNPDVLRIRLHEIWEPLIYSFETHLSNLLNLSIIVGIFRIFVKNCYEFFQNRIMAILEPLEELVCRDANLGITEADSIHGTIRYKLAYQILHLLSEISENVVSRCLFSKLAFLAVKMLNPKNAKSLRQISQGILGNLFNKNPPLIRNLLIQLSKGSELNVAFVTFALKCNSRALDIRAPLELPPLRHPLDTFNKVIQ